MIDFANSTIVKLSPSQAGEDVMNMLIQGEEVYRSFRGARDSVHFTSKRIIAVNVQGLTGKKTDYSSLPYSKIQACQSRPPAGSTGTVNLRCGSADSARSGLSSRARWTSRSLGKSSETTFCSSHGDVVRAAWVARRLAGYSAT